MTSKVPLIGRQTVQSRPPLRLQSLFQSLVQRNQITTKGKLSRNEKMTTKGDVKQKRVQKFFACKTFAAFMFAFEGVNSMQFLILFLTV